MKNFLSNLWSLLVGSRKDDGSTRLRVDYVSFTSRLRVWQYSLGKIAAVVCMLLTIGIGNVWGAVNNGDLFERISAAPAANDEVIFVNQEETYACGTTQNTNNRAVVSISTSSHQYIYASSNNVQVFTVKKNSTNFGFHTGTGYIYSASNSKNYLKTNSTAASTSPSGTSAWSSTVSSSVFKFKNATNTSYYLQFNGTSYFSQYTNTQKDPYLYKKVMSAPTAVAASSITANSATITVTDATNVNNYELYYSTSSTAPLANTAASTTITGGKSKSITGLNASTTYYLWARAFSTSPARKTGWVALSGSTFTTTAPPCTAPSSVSITGTNKYLGGQTISLTATPSGGSGTTSYQWQKKVNGEWTNLSNGTVSGVTISGATSNNLQISSCGSGNSGGYRCVVSTGITCSTNSHADNTDGFGVHVFSLNGGYYGGAWSANEIVWSSGTTGTATVHLNASSTYMFKVYSNNGYYYGNADGNFIIQPVSWDCGTGNENIRLLTGPEGDYTFTVNIEHGLDGSPYVNVQIGYPSVSHPSTGYMYITKWWNTCYVHYWEGTNNALSSWGSDPAINSDRYTTICGTDYWYFPVIAAYNNFIAKDAAGDAGNSTGDQVSTDHGGKYITHDGSWGWHDFATYTITYTAGAGSGSMPPLTGICPGSDQVVGTNMFTAPSHYHFNGWTSSSSVTVNGSSTTSVPAGATIQSVSGDVTLTAQWAPDVYTVSSTLTNCSCSPSIPSSYTYTGSAANVTYTISPNSGCLLPATVSVSGSTYTWDPNTGQLKLTGIITGNVSITVTAVQTHNIIFNTGGLVSIDNVSVAEGATYNITEDPSSSLSTYCEYFKFVGWTTSSSIANASICPSLVTSVTMSTTDVNLYAVYTNAVNDVLTRATTGIATDANPAYGDWEDKLGVSGAVYAGNSAGGNDAIQLRTTNSNSGIVMTTASGMDCSKVIVDWNSNTANGRTIDIYGKNTAYSAASDLYSDDSHTKGTKLGSIEYGTSTELAITGRYEYIGIRSNANALYLNSVTITWGGDGSTAYSMDASCSAPAILASSHEIDFEDKKVGESSTLTFTVSGVNLSEDISLSVSGTHASMFSIDQTTLTETDGEVESTTITVTYTPSSTGSHSAQIDLTSTGASPVTILLTGTGKWGVTWMVDGEVYETTLVANATKPTFPDRPSSFDLTSNEFYGWATAEWKGRIDDLAGKTVYTSNSDMATVNTNGRIYYAVFAKSEGEAPPYNTLIWSEDFSAYSANGVPSGSITNSHTGTTLYGGGSVTYACANNNTKIYEEESSGGTSPELLVYQSNGSFTVSGLPKAGAAEMTISYKQNAHALATSVSGTGYSGGGNSSAKGTSSFTITCGSAATFSITFSATTANNVRLDDIELRLSRSAAYSRYMTNSREDIYVTSASDIMTQASMTMNINRSAIKSGSVSIADETGDQGGTFHAVITDGTADAEDGLNANVKIQYTPTQADVSETATMTVVIGTADTYTFTVYGRSLPETFAIVGKVGAVWTALPADALSSGLHAGYGLTVDDTDAPTEATLAPEAALYKYYARTTKGADYIRLAGSENNKALWSSSSNGIKVWAAINGGSATGDSYEWQLATTDNTTYTLWNKAANSGAGRNLGINSDKKWGMHATAATNELRFLPVTSTATYIAMNVTNWGATMFTFTTGDVIPSYSSITVLYGDESFSATMSGSGTYALNISGIDFSAHSGEQLVVQWKDGSGNAVAQGAVITPIFISSANTDFAGYDIDILPTNDVLITNGATLTITTNSLSVRNLTVEGGSTLNISTAGGGAGVTFHMNSLSLRGGWTTINDEQTYDMPRVYINPASTLTKTQTTVNMDISVNKNNYYPFAVPFPVAVSAVDYADSYLASHSTYGTHYVVKKYNGENRAINGSVDANWVVVESGETLQPGTGYILTAVPVGGEAVIRFPMIFANTWTTGGEKGSITVDAVTTTKNVIPVSAYSGAAATEDKRHAGWNLLGVPFMACYKTDDGMHNQADGFLTGKMTLSGDPSDPYDWADDGAIYVSVPTHDFSEYLQFDITDDDTKLLPGWCFFMQIAKDGYLTFDVSDQQSSSDLPIYAPQRANDDKPVVKTGIVLSDGNKSDKTTLLISDRYSAEYEVGADLEKMFGNDYTLATYSVAGNTPLAFNAMSTAQAKGLIPIGVRLPENGEYTFSLNSRYADVNIDRLDLIDYETGEITNLMQGDYTFTATRCQTEERFALNVTQRKDTPTGNEQIDSGGGRVRKVIIEDKLFILRDGLLYNATGQRVMTINE